MNPKETTEYIKLRGAAIMFLEMEKEYANIKHSSSGYEAKFKALISLDAARSVLWDVINDKEIKP